MKIHLKLWLLTFQCTTDSCDSVTFLLLNFFNDKSGQLITCHSKNYNLQSDDYRMVELSISSWDGIHLGMKWAEEEAEYKKESRMWIRIWVMIKMIRLIQA